MLPPIDLACDPICRGESLNRPTHAIRNPCLVSIADALSLSDLSRQLENYLVNQYLVSPHSTTGQAPQTRWEAGGFLPQMPDSLEKLDLLLLTVPKTMRVRPDGIHFLGMRYIDPTLAAYVGEEYWRLTIRQP